MSILYPTVPEKSPTGHWHSAWKNPAEDNWVLDTNIFEDRLSEEYVHTQNWLTNRIFFSMTLAVLFNVNGSSVQLTLRPCNKTRYLQMAIPLTRTWSYDSLYSTAEQGPIVEEPLVPYAEKVAKKFFDSLTVALSRLDSDTKPTHIVLSYDDDTEMLLCCQEEAPELYERYCSSKDLERFD